MHTKVELKNVKHAAFASQETNCFTATVYIDGVKEGEASNQGHGGSNMYYPYALQEKLNAIAATLPPIPFEGHEPLKQNADILVGDLLNAYLEKRQLNRMSKKKTLFRLNTETYSEGEWRTLLVPYSDAAVAHLTKKYGTKLQEVYQP